MGEPKATGNSNSHTGESGVAQVEITLEYLFPNSASCPFPRCIYRVPQMLRTGYEEAYTPKLISIGPYHSRKSSLKVMNYYKEKYVVYFLKRTKVELATYVKMARGWEPKVRACYSEDIGFNNPDELVRMILVDGMFLVEFVLRFRGAQSSDDQLFMQKYATDISRDLMLLENQIPLFLFEDLYKTYKDDKEWISLLISFCDLYVPVLRIARDLNLHSVDTQKEHLVDFLHSICITTKKDDPSFSSTDTIQRPQRQDDFFRSMYRILFSLMDRIRGRQRQDDYSSLTDTTPGRQFAISRSATELHEIGVKFEPISDETNCNNGLQFTQLKFDEKQGKLQMAPLSVTRHTDSIFRNLIAYEHCHRKHNIFRSYVIFMDYLINTPDDVELLIKSKIIDNTLGESEDVCTLFNSLYKITMIDNEDFSYARTCSMLHDYSKNWWHRQRARWFRWKVSLNRQYFSSPWAIISFIAACILLALTVIQTVCSIKSTQW